MRGLGLCAVLAIGLRAWTAWDNGACAFLATVAYAACLMGVAFMGNGGRYGK